MQASLDCFQTCVHSAQQQEPNQQHDDTCYADLSGVAQLGVEGYDATAQQLRLQLPHYIQCFQTPVFTSGPLQGDCNALHDPAPNGQGFVHPNAVFREQDTVTIDVSRCGFYINSTAASGDQGGAVDLLQPFQVKLRPRSTDHDVFIQACFDRLSCLLSLVTAPKFGKLYNSLSHDMAKL